MTHQERFEIFWEAYPRKIGKGAARKSFERAMKNEPKDELLQLMINTIAIFKTSPQWQKDNGAFIPHPATWINQERWFDVYERPQGIHTGDEEPSF